MATKKLDHAILLGRKISEARRAKKISQERLAELLDKHVTYISQLERGEKTPSLETLLTLAKTLEVSPAFLLDVPEYKVTKETADLLMICSKATRKEVEIATDVLKVLIDKRNK